MGDRSLIEAIKGKLRHWITDHAGLFPPPCIGSTWATALEEVAAEIRRNLKKSGDEAMKDQEIENQE